MHARARSTKVTNARRHAAVRSRRRHKGRRVRLVLADDHGLVAEGLRMLLEPEYEVVAIVPDGAALIDAVREYRPDIVIADISMPRVNGIDAIRALRREAVGVRTICLTMHADPTYLAEALDAGARGFVLKHSAPDEIRDALRVVVSGGTYVTPLLDSATRPRKLRPIPLTARQRQVLRLVAQGYTVKRVAQAIGVSPKTVEFHKYRVMERLGATSTAELVRYAVQHGVATN